MGTAVAGVSDDGGDRLMGVGMVGGDAEGALTGFADMGDATVGLFADPAMGNCAVCGLDGNWVVEGENVTRFNELVVLPDLDLFPDPPSFEKIFAAVDCDFSCFGGCRVPSDARRDEESGYDAPAF